MPALLRKKYAICVCNQGHKLSLDLWKVYRILPDKLAEQTAMIRIIDNENEDYLYPTAWFVPIDVPLVVERKIKAAAKPPVRRNSKNRVSADKP